MKVLQILNTALFVSWSSGPLEWLFSLQNKANPDQEENTVIFLISVYLWTKNWDNITLPGSIIKEDFPCNQYTLLSRGNVQRPKFFTIGLVPFTKKIKFKRIILAKKHSLCPVRTSNGCSVLLFPTLELKWEKNWASLISQYLVGSLLGTAI